MATVNQRQINKLVKWKPRRVKCAAGAHQFFKLSHSASNLVKNRKTTTTAILRLLFLIFFDHIKHYIFFVYYLILSKHWSDLFCSVVLLTLQVKLKLRLNNLG